MIAWGYLVPPVVLVGWSDSVSRAILVYDLGLESALTAHRSRCPLLSLALSQLFTAWARLFGDMKGALRLCVSILLLLFGVMFNLVVVLWKHFRHTFL